MQLRIVLPWSKSSLLGLVQSFLCLSFVFISHSSFAQEMCTLTVMKNGTGSGTVTDTGIDCGTDCEQTYVCGTVVTLMQMADPDSEFAGFTGDSDCADGQVTVDANKECTATFDLKPTLTVNIAGTGTGKVTDTDIDCEPNCSASFATDSVVTLTAVSDPVSSTFGGWSGDCSNGSFTTQVTMDANKECTATFNLKPEFSLNVTIAGTGTGKVTDTGIDCEPTCSADFFEGTVVSLMETADTGSEFAGWSGDPDCSDGQVTMDGPKNCVATFDLKTFNLEVATSGDGSGVVTSSPGDIDCGDNCSGTFDFGTVVDLTATPDKGSVFEEWTGDEDCMDGQLTMDVAKNCTAVFNVAPPDHFLCYKTQPRSIKVGNEVSLKDQFETKDYMIKKSIGICNPADKDGEGIQDPDGHLQMYKIKRAKGESKSAKQTNITVENQFGIISVDTKKADRLLVPTAKSLDGFPEPLDDSSRLDHYKCYKVKLSSGQRFSNDLQATVVDEFDQETLYNIKKPERLCNPVDKNGEGIKNRENHLLCYKIKRVRGEPRNEKVEGIRVTNQFGSATLRTRGPSGVKELCVPSIKTITESQ